MAPHKKFRYRKCPSCEKTLKAGEISILDFGLRHWEKEGKSRRQCPVCSYIGITQDFPIENNPPDIDSNSEPIMSYLS